MSLLYLNTIHNIISHSKTRQADVPHHRKLHTVDSVGVRGEIIQCGPPQLSTSTLISLKMQREGVGYRIPSECVSLAYIWGVLLPDSESKLVAGVSSVVAKLPKRGFVGTHRASVGGSRGEVVKIIPAK